MAKPTPTTLSILSLLLCGLVCTGNTITWSGCGPENDPDQLLRMGKPSVVCLQVGNTLNWVAGAKYLRMSFQPNVDQYSRFHIDGSYRELITLSPFAGTNITVMAAQQKKTSFLRQYYNPITKEVFPHLTAIMDVDKGNVRGVTWDDACVFCGGGGACKEITYNFEGKQQTQDSAGQPTAGCPLTQEECSLNSTLCDLNLYVVWSGTDANGLALQSAGYRFSMFPPQDIADRFSQIAPDINPL